MQAFGLSQEVGFSLFDHLVQCVRNVILTSNEVDSKAGRVWSFCQKSKNVCYVIPLENNIICVL